MRERRGACMVVAVTPNEKGLLGERRSRYEENINMHLQEVV
jgi:hypothetical protein